MFCEESLVPWSKAWGRFCGTNPSERRRSFWESGKISGFCCHPSSIWELPPSQPTLECAGHRDPSVFGVLVVEHLGSYFVPLVPRITLKGAGPALPPPVIDKENKCPGHSGAPSRPGHWSAQQLGLEFRPLPIFKILYCSLTF